MENRYLTYIMGNHFLRHSSCRLKRGGFLAYTEVGDRNCSQVLLCLPGLLETRGSFDRLLQAASNLKRVRAIAVDYCGRGGSDALPNDSGYCMSLYLHDVEEFIRSEIFQAGQPRPKLDVIGTSMGGILAMYLASKSSNCVAGLFLNDVGLSLNWMSIYGLFEGMKVSGLLPDTKHIASNLGVTEGAVREAQSPQHFDLPHHKDWKGMKFGHVLSGFNGPVRLIYGGQSGVCLQQQVNEFEKKYPANSLMRIEEASHPVPFTDEVCEFIWHSMHLVAEINKVPEPISTKLIQVQEQLPLEEVPQPATNSSGIQHTKTPNTGLNIATAKDQEQSSAQVFVQSDKARISKGSKWIGKFINWLSRSK